MQTSGAGQTLAEKIIAQRAAIAIVHTNKMVPRKETELAKRDASPTRAAPPISEKMQRNVKLEELSNSSNKRSTARGGGTLPSVLPVAPSTQVSEVGSCECCCFCCSALDGLSGLG